MVGWDNTIVILIGEMMSEAAKEYNDLVQQAVEKGLTGFKPVKRFSDKATADKRIAAIKAALVNGEEVQAPATEAAAAEETKPEKAPKEKKPASKKKVKPTKKVKEASSNKTKTTEIEEILGEPVRWNSKKAKLLCHLIANKSKKIAQPTLVAVVYGNAKKEAVNSFSNCIGGLSKTVAKHGRYKIARERNEKEVTYALVPKG